MATDQEIPESEKPVLKLHRQSEMRKEVQEKVKSILAVFLRHLSRKLPFASIITLLRQRTARVLFVWTLAKLPVRLFAR